MCIKWEKAPHPKRVPNPYKTDRIREDTHLYYNLQSILLYVDLTEAQVQKELADEETSSLASGIIPPLEISPSSFIVLGLELEEMQ